jgi:predicted TIM-barrel fold metal-dependent hydrolase
LNIDPKFIENNALSPYVGEKLLHDPAVKQASSSPATIEKGTRVHVFDAHTHFFSRAFYEFQARQVKDGDVEALLAKFTRNGVDVPGESVSAHRDRIIEELDRNGVDRAVTFASIPDEMEIVGEAAAGSDGRLIPYAMVNPLAPATLTKLESAHERYRYHGMLLFPAMHDYGIGDEAVGAALDLARKLDLVVFVHCGLLRVTIRAILGLESDFPMKQGHPQALMSVAKARPDQTFVIPHFSAGFFDELLLLGKECPNVYVDTAGSNSWGMFQAPPLYLEDLFEQSVDVFGVERILFGSDTAGFPRGYRNDVLSKQVRAMHDAGIRTADQELILGGNLAKLLEV